MKHYMMLALAATVLFSGCSPDKEKKQSPDSGRPPVITMTAPAPTTDTAQTYAVPQGQQPSTIIVQQPQERSSAVEDAAALYMIFGAMNSLDDMAFRRRYGHDKSYYRSTYPSYRRPARAPSVTINKTTIVNKNPVKRTVSKPTKKRSFFGTTSRKRTTPTFSGAGTRSTVTKKRKSFWRRSSRSRSSRRSFSFRGRGRRR